VFSRKRLRGSGVGHEIIANTTEVACLKTRARAAAGLSRRVLLWQLLLTGLQSSVWAVDNIHVTRLVPGIWKTPRLLCLLGIVSRETIYCTILGELGATAIKYTTVPCQGQ
jgi:hypothetical protein